jgi:hypothetical protein
MAMFDDALKRPDASEQDALAKLRTLSFLGTTFKLK